MFFVLFLVVISVMAYRVLYQAIQRRGYTGPAEALRAHRPEVGPASRPTVGSTHIDVFNVSLLPETKIDQRIVIVASTGAIIAAALLGGLIPALLMTGAVAFCFAPTVTTALRTRREVRALIKGANLNSDSDLFVPEDWHS